jgi:hypothetical protein
LLELAEDSHNPERSAILAGDYKLIVSDSGASYRLFNLKEDPGEKKDLSKSAPDKFTELKNQYDATYGKLPRIEPYGGMKLKSGREARGPTAPQGVSRN